MKLFKNPIAKAVGAALALASGSAFAYQPTSNADADVVIYWGGATASTLSAQELTLGAICASDAHVLYVPTGTGATPGAPLNDWVIACRTSAALTGIPDGTRVMVVKRDRGGSGVGVGPVQSTTPITFLNVASNCTGVPGAGAPTFPAFPTAVVQTCIATYDVSRVVEMGTSDIEPNKFFGINTPIVDGAPYPVIQGQGFEEQFALAALTFNTPVTLALYQTLQLNQFPATSVCNPNNAGYATALPASVQYRAGATNGESEACMPSLTRSEIASLLGTGRITQWNRLLTSTGASMTPFGPALGTLAVQICRRVEGSGSQATINAEISGWPCDTDSDGAINIVNPKPVTVPGPGPVFGNSGSGDVSNCLRDRNLDATNPYAIGVLSVEGRNTNRALGWRYIKIDGVAPTLKNIHGGDYPYFAQQSCQRRAVALGYNAAVNPLDTVANKALIFTSLCGPAAANGLNNINTVNTLNAGSLYDWGYSGWLATPTTTLTYDNVLDYLPVAGDGTPARPVNAFTHEVALGVTNHCQHPLKSSFGTNSARGMIIDVVE